MTSNGEVERELDLVYKCLFECTRVLEAFDNDLFSRASPVIKSGVKAVVPGLASRQSRMKIVQETISKVSHVPLHVFLHVFLRVVCVLLETSFSTQ